MASPIDAALREFEAVEANLVKLERLWAEIKKRIPEGISFGSDSEYDYYCRSFEEIVKSLPLIDGWKIENTPLELNVIAQNRFDATEVGEIECQIGVEETVSAPGREIQTYRYKLDRKRRELIRGAVFDLIEKIDSSLRELVPQADIGKDGEFSMLKVSGEHWELFSDFINQIDTLLGSSVARSQDWGKMIRHRGFGVRCDLVDIIERDWPGVKSALTKDLYHKDDPIPTNVKDLAELTAAQPKGKVATRLYWEKLDDEGFERLIFLLICSAKGYENPQWLTKTNATDRGRDLSVNRIITDSLAGTVRQRVIIQCKNWLNRSISIDDLATLREQMKLWEPPRVDVCIVATTGRFTTDAVDWIEKHNQASDRAMRLEMWPESHLEQLLAAHPALIAEFQLR